MIYRKGRVKKDSLKRTDEGENLTERTAEGENLTERTAEGENLTERTDEGGNLTHASLHRTLSVTS